MYTYNPATYTLNDNWWLSESGKTYGPLSWNDIVHNVDQKQVTVNAYIKHATWPNWAPITIYFQPNQLVNPEMEGFIPGRYDLMYYSGVGLFILGIFAVMAFPPIGFLIFILSITIEIIAVYLDHVNKLPSTSSKLGNICAGIFIIVQLVVMILFIFIVM